MTIHFNPDSDHYCTACGKFFIPLKSSGYQCFSCGQYNNPGTMYISNAVASINYNLERYSSIIPPAWISMSINDQVLYKVFIMLNNYQNVEDKSIEEYSKDIMSTLILSENDEYLRENIRLAFIEIYLKLKEGD